MIKVLSPKTIPAPSGTYVHGMEIPPNARLLFIAGQTPGRMDGSIPDNIDEQLDVVWQRIGAILAEAGMGYGDLIKVQTFVTKPEYLRHTSEARKRVLGGHRPTATLLCITSLATPEYMVEIEAVAAKV